MFRCYYSEVFRIALTYGVKGLRPWRWENCGTGEYNDEKNQTLIHKRTYNDMKYPPKFELCSLPATGLFSRKAIDRNSENDLVVKTKPLF